MFWAGKCDIRLPSGVHDRAPRGHYTLIKPLHHCRIQSFSARIFGKWDTRSSGACATCGERRAGVRDETATCV
eukprot:761816-Pyramimonas_sp.AAC.1